MKARTFLVILFGFLSLAITKAERFDLKLYLESKMEILEIRNKQLDPRGIYIGDVSDFLDPICILSKDSIEYDPHARRLNYGKYHALKRWMLDNQLIVNSSLFLEAYYACFYHSGRFLSSSIPANKYFEIIPVEILNEDIERRISSNNKDNANIECSDILDLLLIDNDYAIDTLAAETVFSAITSDSLIITKWAKALLKYEEAERIAITRKMFVYYFYSYFRNIPLGCSFDAKEIDNCWNTFISSPMKKWIMKKDTDYYIRDHTHGILEPFRL